MKKKQLIKRLEKMRAALYHVRDVCQDTTKKCNYYPDLLSYGGKAEAYQVAIGYVEMLLDDAEC
jgi:hypothetical protein